MVRRGDFIRIAAYLFLVTGSFGFLQPFVPLYMRAAGMDKAQIGEIAGLGVFAALLIQPTLGRWSDRLDARRPFIFAAGPTAFIAYSSTPFVHTYGAFFGAAALGNAGLMYLNAAGGALVGRMVQASKGGEAYGGLRLWGSIGYIFTSFASGLIVNSHAGAMTRATLDPVFRFGPATFLGIAILAWLLPDVRRTATTTERPERAPLPPNLKRFLVAYFLYNVSLYGVSALMSLFLQTLGARGLAITGVFAAGVFVEVLVMRWSGRFSDRFGRRPAMAISFVLLPIRLLLYMPATGPLWVLAVQSLHGVNFGIMGAVAVVFVNDLANDRTRGHAQARLFSVAGLATAIGPIVFGLVAEKTSLVAMFGVAAVIAAIGAIAFLWTVEDSHPHPESLADRAPHGMRKALRWLDAPVGSSSGG